MEGTYHTRLSNSYARNPYTHALADAIFVFCDDANLARISESLAGPYAGTESPEPQALARQEQDSVSVPLFLPPALLTQLKVRKYDSQLCVPFSWERSITEYLSPQACLLVWV